MKTSNKYIIYTLGLFLFQGIGFSQNVTPSHAYQQSEIIVRELRLLREAVGADDYPIDPEPQTLKRPIQVYGKGLELLYKIGYAQEKFGLPKLPYKSIPTKKITPSDVMSLCKTIETEILKIKTYLAIPTSIEDVPLVKSKVPSNVYENLWRASYLTDYLSGAIKPNDVYSYTEAMIGDITIFAKAYNIKFNGLKIPPLKTGIRPKDVAAQGVQNLQKLIRIEKKLGYRASIVPTMTLSRASPSDVFDIVGMLMSELAYLKSQNNITGSAKFVVAEGKKTPADVLQRMQYAGSLLDRTLAGVKRK
jgi:hypothetical protein